MNERTSECGRDESSAHPQRRRTHPRRPADPGGHRLGGAQRRAMGRARRERLGQDVRCCASLRSGCTRRPARSPCSARRSAGPTSGPFGRASVSPARRSPTCSGPTFGSSTRSSPRSTPRSSPGGTPTARDDFDQAAAALDRVGVAHLAERTFGTLSSGERQRVQLARTLFSRTRTAAARRADRWARSRRA